MAEPKEVTPRVQTPARPGTTPPAVTNESPNGASEAVAADAAPKPDPGGTANPPKVEVIPEVKPKTEVIVYEEFWKPLDIKRLIFATTEFIVYLSSDGHVGWQTMSSVDVALNALDKAEVGAVHNRSTEINAMPIEHLNDIQRTNFRVMMGEGLARLFSLDPKSALQMMNAAGAYASARNQEIARGWQLKGTAWAAGVSFGVACVAWMARGPLRDWVGELAFVLLLGACAGAIGAFFSVLTRLGTNSLDPSAGEHLHILEGRARVVAGAIGAVFAALAVHLSLILGVLKSFGHPALIFIALIAGASERLVPTIIKRTEDDAASSGKPNPNP